MSDLLQEIEKYLSQTGMSASTFGFHAANDGKFVPRIRDGGRCWPETTERVRAFMAENPAQKDGATA